MYSAVVLVPFLVAAVRGQQIGTLVPEVHPTITTQKCVKGGTCTTQNNAIVLDSNWRWLHTSTGTNCYTGNTWNTAACPDPTTCAANCQLDGAQYASTYGITTSGNALTLDFVTGANVGSRTYLMSGPNTYDEFYLLNQEFTFDVDVSALPCGLNGALYFSQMAADGGMAANPGNKAGAAYGTGYCDAQCPQDLKFINGKANIAGWTPASNNANTGTGGSGACCFEMDIWEANSHSAAYTPHVCAAQGLYQCTGAECGNNPSTGRYTAPCDKNGCDYNSYRMGNTTFYGAGKTVDTTKKFTVVTQFITNDGTATGTLVEIRRIYEQNGVVIMNSVSDIPGVTGNSITDNFCVAQKAAFTEVADEFETLGGLAAMGTAMKGGMVLVMSLWDDYSVNMLWLDSTYPTTGGLGSARGDCATTSGVPAQVEAASPGAKVTYSNIKVGDLGSTYGSGNEVVPPWGGSSPPPPPPPPPSSSTTMMPPPPTSSTTTMMPPPPPPTTGVCMTLTSTYMVTTVVTSTITVGSSPPPPPPQSSSTTMMPPPPSGGTVPKWGQCGGQGWTGGTVCASGSTCKFSSQYYSQCL